MKHKKTLKKRISQSMRLVSSLSSLLLASLLIFLCLSILSPLTYYFSKSFVLNIYKHFDNSMSMNRITGQPLLNPALIGTMSFDDILSQKTPASTTDQSNTTAIESVLSESNLIVSTESISDYQKKLLAYAVSKAYEEMNNFFSTSLLGVDTLLVTFKESDKTVFTYPLMSAFPDNYPPDFSNKKATGIDQLYQHIYENSRSTIGFQNENGDVLGTLEVMVNPILLFALLVPLGFIILLAMLVSSLLSNILTRLLVKPLIKPLELVNTQMTSHINEQLSPLTPIQFEVKNPPLEIQLLMDNSAALLLKFTEMNYQVELQKDELEAQKEELEAQNIELEEQNLELIDTKDLLQKQQDQLVRSEKMASVGQLSAAIAHEINTPLGAIQSNSQMMDMLLEALPTDEEGIKNKAIQLLPQLAKSNAITLIASRRVAEIVKSLKNFSRIDQSDFQKYDVRDGFASVFILTSNLWKNRVTLVENYISVPLIDCYPSLLNQVFMNVVVNGIQSMDEGGTLTITIEEKSPILSIRIQDTGTGIMDGLLDMIFESGFTTKPADKGTGLGLSISKEIIDKHRGKIYAESELGVGTTMFIELPISQS